MPCPAKPPSADSVHEFRRSRVTPPKRSQDEVIDIVSATQRFWADRTGNPVTPEDAREAIRNIAAYFDLLAEWEAGGSESARDDPGSSADTTGDDTG
jgi:hypothetical protein